jgi:transposase
MTAMIPITVTEADIAALDDERYHYPCPQIQKRMDVLYRKAQGVAHQEIARICRMSRQTLVTSLPQYQAGGIDALKARHYQGQPRALNAHQSTVDAHVRAHPLQTVAEAQAVIAELTGIQRSPTQIRAFLRRMGMRLRKMGALPGHAQDPEKQAEQATFQQAQLEPRLAEVRAGKRTLFVSTPPTSSTEPL